MNFIIVKGLALLNVFIIKILIYYSKIEIPKKSEEGKEEGRKRRKRKKRKRKGDFKKSNKVINNNIDNIQGTNIKE
jgi:hypothetical protein